MSRRKSDGQLNKPTRFINPGGNNITILPYTLPLASTHRELLDEEVDRLYDEGSITREIYNAAKEEIASKAPNQ